MHSKTGKKHRWTPWKGLLGEDRPKVRRGVLISLLILSTAMTFMQLGFVGVGINGDYDAYVLALLGPVSVASILLGSLSGGLMGLAAGSVLYLHSKIQPLDMIEKYLITSANSVALFAVVGLLLGFFYARVFRKEQTKARRIVKIVLINLFVSIIATLIFEFAAAMRMFSLASTQIMLASLGAGNSGMQVVLDTALITLLCLGAVAGVRRYQETHSYISVRSIVRLQLLTALMLVFVSVTAVSFVAITAMEQNSAYVNISGELDFLKEQFSSRNDHILAFLTKEETKELSNETLKPLYEMISPAELLKGYDLTDGTLIMYDGTQEIYCNNENFAMGTVSGFSLEEVDGIEVINSSESGSQQQDNAEGDAEYTYFSDEDFSSISELVKTGEMREILYNTSDTDFELGYLQARDLGADLTLAYAKPYSIVFANRLSTMHWTSLITFVLLAVVYVLVNRLLKDTVVSPVERTNETLFSITQGNLDAMVTEVNSIEFASLSAGINTCVYSLKEYAAETERRIERDLATARAIQEGALPRNFPAFPDIADVDLFASMNAAKEVGGDFYDFFPIDDETVGFLIADVSGKGIPGALFMMAAKTEIGNRMQDGMELAQAIRGANAYLCAHNEAGMFVTVWAATLKWKTGELTYVNAGHNFPLLRHGKGGDWEWIKKKCGLFLGTFDIAKYRQETLMLEPGDELLLYTDGVNEAFNVAEEEYGNDQLEAFLASHADLRPQDMVRELRADVARWAEGAEQSDDVTILAMEYRLDG